MKTMHSWMQENIKNDRSDRQIILDNYGFDKTLMQSTLQWYV